MTLDPRSVLAIVVTFHPKRSLLLSLVSALKAQVESVLLVDNTPLDDQSTAAVLNDVAKLAPLVRIARLGRNFGIAVAQNVGLNMALDEGFGYVLLSDQDSIPGDNMVSVLRDSCELLQRDYLVGCICPQYFDNTSAQAMPFQVHVPGSIFYKSTHVASPWLEIITTISSGALIPAETIRAVGPMRDDFFIDHVDTEWCHRARALGFHNFGTTQARLTHCLGDAPFRVWYFGWRRASEYSPIRLYFRFRNFILLCRLPHVPLRWRIRATWYWLGNMYAHCFFGPHRSRNARAILLGLWDGAIGRRGPAKRKL